jgi:hypothetical protein
VPVLRLSKRRWFGRREHATSRFYGYQFYLADETRASVFLFYSACEPSPVELAAQ